MNGGGNLGNLRENAGNGGGDAGNAGNLRYGVEMQEILVGVQGIWVGLWGIRGECGK